MQKIKVGPKEISDLPGKNGTDRRYTYLKEEHGLEILEDWKDDYGVHRFKIKKLNEESVRTVKGYAWYNLLKLYLPDDF